MKFSRWMALVGLVLAPGLRAGAEPAATLGHVEGRVLTRVAQTKKLEPVAAGRPLEAGEVLVSGDASRYEVRPVTGGGLWRVGRRAVFSLKEGGARLLSGTALAQVPAKASWRVESTRSVVALPEGTWLVQAVDNRGLKIVCLDGSDPVRAHGLPAGPSEKPLAELKLRPGEIAFLQPEGASFSPPVTIFLEETLGTSRLVGGFPDELPGLRRLINQAIAQSERLKGVTNAVVVGASKAGGFQIAVPNPPAKDVSGEAAEAGTK